MWNANTDFFSSCEFCLKLLGSANNAIVVAFLYNLYFYSNAVAAFTSFPPAEFLSC